MTDEQTRMNEVKGLIFSKGMTLKEFAKQMGYSSYEGFKKAIKQNRKNKYYESLKILKDL